MMARRKGGKISDGDEFGESINNQPRDIVSAADYCYGLALPTGPGLLVWLDHAKRKTRDAVFLIAHDPPRITRSVGI
jgi:hypothetical protein